MACPIPYGGNNKTKVGVDCGHSANLECRSEMWCTRLAGNAGCKKIAKNSPCAHHCTICRAMSSQLRHILTIGKKTY